MILNQIQKIIDELEIMRGEVERAPEKDAIVDLINACENIDRHYKQFCREMDQGFGEQIGTAYKTGICIEYEIEADWWHDVSIALRKLKKS